MRLSLDDLSCARARRYSIGASTVPRSSAAKGPSPQPRNEAAGDVEKKDMFVLNLTTSRDPNWSDPKRGSTT